jgi:hypothetical protein
MTNTHFELISPAQLSTITGGAATYTVPYSETEVDAARKRASGDERGAREADARSKAYQDADRYTNPWSGL